MKWTNYLNTLSSTIRESLILIVGLQKGDIHHWDGALYHKNYNLSTEYEPKADCAIAFIGSSEDTGEFYLVFDGPHRGDIIVNYGLGDRGYMRTGDVNELIKIIKCHGIIT